MNLDGAKELRNIETLDRYGRGLCIIEYTIGYEFSPLVFMYDLWQFEETQRSEI